MNRYTLEQLRSSSTYDADPALATLARRVAERRTDLDLPVGERKRLALAGGMAESVHEALETALAADAAAASERQEVLAAWSSLDLPGWTIALGPTEAELRGPRDEAVNASLRRHGRWDPRNKAWRVPIDKGLTLARSLRRSAGPAATQAREQAAQNKRRAEIERWIGYVEEASRQGRVYQRGIDECRSLGIEAFSDLKQRLDRALTGPAAQAARVAAQRAEIERWIAYIESSASEGRIYQRGLDACRANHIEAFPDLASRMDRALSAARTQAAANDARRAQAQSARDLYPLSNPPAVGVPCRLGKAVVVYTHAGKRFRIDEDHPSIHGSRLLGHEGEWGAYFYRRDATDAETAALVQREAEEAAARAADNAHRDAVRRLSDAIRVPAHLLPRGSAMPQGVVVHDTRNIYGGGSAILVSEDGAVYFIQANGADGDDWSANNLPGAIGWCARDAHLLEQAKEITRAAV